LGPRELEGEILQGPQSADRLGITILGSLLDPRAIGGDESELRADEESVQKDEAGDGKQP